MIPCLESDAFVATGRPRVGGERVERLAGRMFFVRETTGTARRVCHYVCVGVEVCSFVCARVG